MLVTVPVEIPKRIVRRKVLELDDQVREHVLDRLHKLVHERVHLGSVSTDAAWFAWTCLLTRRSGTAHANVERIVEVTPGIGAEIETDGDLGSIMHHCHQRAQHDARRTVDVGLMPAPAM